MSNHEAPAGHDAHAADAAHAGHDSSHSPEHYWKIAKILMVLAAISYLGPMLEIKVLTMITAFGIACIKAFLVIKHFMHLTIEKRPVGYFLITAVAFMFLFYAGVSPDVMEHEGRNWVNVGARNETARAQAAHAAGGEHGEHGGHGEHAAPATPGHEGHEAHGEHGEHGEHAAPAGH